MPLTVNRDTAFSTLVAESGRGLYFFLITAFNDALFSDLGPYQISAETLSSLLRKLFIRMEETFRVKKTVAGVDIKEAMDACAVLESILADLSEFTEHLEELKNHTHEPQDQMEFEPRFGECALCIKLGSSRMNSLQEILLKLRDWIREYYEEIDRLISENS